MEPKTRLYINKSYLIGAVGTRKHLQGFVRMKADGHLSLGKRGHVEGIHLKFETYEQQVKLSKNPFFYGSNWTLEKNYRRFPPENLTSQNFGISNATNSEINRRRHLGFMQIPIKKMNLGEVRESLVKRLTSSVRAQLPDWIKKLKQKKVPSIKGLAPVFRSFPKDLAEIVRKTGRYYNLSVREREITGEFDAGSIGPEKGMEIAEPEILVPDYF